MTAGSTRWRWLVLAPLFACTGSIHGGAPGDPAQPGDPGRPGDRGSGGAPADPGGGGGTPVKPSADDPFGGPGGLRRLTRREYDRTIADLLGDTSARGFAKLPEDANDPFDNDYTTQVVSGALIAAAEGLAADTAAAAVADPARRAALLGCTPSGPGDSACLRSFITSFGRRALRRPLTAAEVDAYAAFGAFSVESKDFFTGVELVLRAMLQDPSFLYRVELGEPVAGTPGVYRLGDFEIATRLAYLLWGSTPSDALLDLAQQGKLGSAEDRRAAAAMLLDDRRGHDRLAWFHAFWLSYHQLPFAADLAAGLRAEADALVDKVVFSGQDFFTLFTAGETFLTPALATHYGLPAPAAPGGGWVPYGAGLRRGILSTGAVLSVGAKFDDTSPTLRGVFVRNRLLCEPVPKPPPNVDVDQAPMAAASRCKVDRYRAHGQGGCAACHSQLDPIGFGLDNFDSAGRFRDHEKAAPECAIAGEGSVDGLGAFKGPGALGALLVGSGALEACVVRQLHHFAVGRKDVAADAPLLDALTEGFKKNGRQLRELLLDLVASQAFAHRRVVD